MLVPSSISSSDIVFSLITTAAEVQRYQLQLHTSDVILPVSNPWILWMICTHLIKFESVKFWTYTIPKIRLKNAFQKYIKIIFGNFHFNLPETCRVVLSKSEKGYINNKNPVFEICWPVLIQPHLVDIGREMILVNVTDSSNYMNSRRQIWIIAINIWSLRANISISSLAPGGSGI